MPLLKRKELLFLSLFSLFCMVVYAQYPEEFYLQRLDNRNGLSNSSINHLFKDRDNLLWVATWDGLNMYDGTSFHVFNYSKQNDFRSIGSNVIRHITEDKRGNTWICTMEGISRYEKTGGRFHNYFYRQHPVSRISEQEYQLVVNADGTVFCLARKYGLTCYDATADSFRLCSLPRTNIPVNQFFFDAANRLWLLNNQGEVEVFAEKDHHFIHLKTYRDPKGISGLFYADGKIFFSAADNRLLEVEERTLFSVPVMQLKHHLTSLAFYKGHWLLAWSAKGYDVVNENFQPSSFLKEEARQMQDVKVTAWTLGSEQILWVGTDGNGLIKIYPKTKSFGTVITTENGMSYNSSVRAFCEENGNLWLGTKGNGIMKIPGFKVTNPVNPGKQYFQSPRELDNNSVFALTKGADDRIYIGTDGDGLGVYDQKYRKFYKWSDIKGTAHTAEFGSVYAILEDKDHSLWLGTSGYGLVHLVINRKSSGVLALGFLESFTYNNDNSGPANDIIYSLAEGKDDRLWMACRYGGLSFFDKKERRFTTFKAFTYEGSLSNNDVLAVCIDSKNRLWVGTSYGLNWINEKDAVKKEPVFQKLTTTNGLPNNTIHAISEDSMGNIWVSTNKGLAKIQPVDLKVSHYQLPDGLQSNEFCDGAVWKNTDGYLFFGGTYGFNYFLPQNIRKTDRIPGLLVSGIIIGGKNENNFTVVNPGDDHPLSFSMKREDNFFEINAVTLSYLNAEKCEYAYYLEGYDKTWHYPGVPGKITYSNLLPGHYTLMIKWSNGEGNWTVPSPLAKLEVKQYPWLTLPVLLIYTLLLLTVGFLFYRYRKNKLEIKHQLDMEHRMRTREEQIHEDRIGFFTNIAHELQTPLTLIMGSTERFLEKNNPPGKQQEKPYFLSLIHQQASRLTYLLQQLLEFRKAESDMLNNQYSYLDLSESLNNLATPFITLSEKNGMDYQRNIAPEITGWMDKDKLEKILFNLLSNAFKHSGKNEKVIFSAIENKATGELKITVANSGSEIPESQLYRIFDKFYRAGPGTVYDEHFGTGIGLAFTRQLVTLLKGKIEVTSEKGWITFTVSLPLMAEGAEMTGPERNVPVTLKPSYLYQSIIAYPKTDTPVSATENNKQALVEKLDTGNRKNILVVEDDVDLRFLLKDILKDNYNVFEAENGKVAVELILKTIPDLIISDVMMPRMDGLELCNRVKNAPATCHIPFIILSVKGSMEQKTEGYEVGADAYIAKPFRIDHLQVRVRKLLEYRDKLNEFFKNDRSSTLPIEPELADSDREFLNKLVSIIEKHLDDEELNAQLIEKELALSKMQLYRKLKTMTDMTPAEFIKHIRLKRAAHLLATTHLTVSEIFYSTGFNNQSYFYREFKKRYLCAPNDYRAQQTVEKG